VAVSPLNFIEQFDFVCLFALWVQKRPFLERPLKTGFYQTLFLFIAAFALAACAEKTAISKADMTDMVFIGAGESKIIDRHGRCILYEDLSKGHDGYYISTSKELWDVLTLGERDTPDGARPVRMSECP